MRTIERLNPLSYVIIAIVPICVLVSFLATAFYRYGGNPNNYGMLLAWQTMIRDGVYLPSRFQGNLPSEIILGNLAHAFGPIGANSFSLLCAIAALILTYLIFRPFERDRLTLGLALAAILANPYFALSSIIAMDYVHPIPAFLGGVLLLQRRLPVLAAILFALAGAMRLSYAPMGLMALGYALFMTPDRPSRMILAQSTAAFLVLLGYMYVPAFISAHLTLSFLGNAPPVWDGWFGWIARWIYKTIYLYGLLGSLVVAFIVAGFVLTSMRGAPDEGRGARRQFLYLCIGVIVFHLLLFFYLPVRIEYLIPAVIAFSGLMIYYKTSQWLMMALIVAELSYAFVSVEVLRIDHLNSAPCAPVVPTAVKFAPHFAPGVIWNELTGTTNEVACLPRMLLEPSETLGDRLPKPARR